MARLTRQEDAFGQGIWDHHHGRGSCEIAERDDGWIDISSGPAAYFRPQEEWPAYEREAIALAAGRVLDVGCGAGRAALYLQAKGLEVVGIDNSPLAVKVCRLRGVRDARLMSVTRVSAAALGQFDTILMFYNPMGNPRRARWLLGRFGAMTGASGRIIASGLDPYDTQEPSHLAYHKLNRRCGRMGGQARIRIRYKQYATPWFDYLMVSRNELRRLVAGTGWRVAKTIDPKGARYIAVLEKENRP